MRESTDSDEGEIIRFGTIVEIDLAKTTAVVDCGDARSASIRWAHGRCGKTRIYSPPSIGEQVVLACPHGDLDGAVIIGSLHKLEMPPPASDGRLMVAFEDGAILSYDPSAHALACTLPGGATASIDAPAGLTIKSGSGVAIDADVTIEGDVDVSGKLTASVDVVGGGKSLKGHKHLAVTAGSGVSGIPQ